jgi:hypothetical protein
MRSQRSWEDLMEKVRTEQVTGYLNVLAETGNARRWKH